MAEHREIDVENIMAELRSEVRKARAKLSEEDRPAAYVKPHSGLDTGGPTSGHMVRADLGVLKHAYNIVGVPFVSHRRMIGRSIIVLKNFTKNLLSQILWRQVTYNAANTRLVTHLEREIESLKTELSQFSTRLASTGEDLRVSVAQAEALQDERERAKKAEQLDIDYFQFEQKYRGSEEDIEHRQRVYLSYFGGRSEVLDIGCGRGEFLGLLRQAGMRCKGVDINADFVAHCQAKSLEVVCDDVFKYLERLPDESLGGIFCAQVIEHLEPHRVVALAKLCYRTLEPNGVAVLETPNPHCLSVFAESFYMDLTHIRPFHPAALKFLLEAAGFERIEVRPCSPVDKAVRIPMLNGSGGEDLKDFNRGLERLNDLIYGFQDYAVIGRKSADE